MLAILTKISLDSHLNGRRFQMINEFLNVFDFLFWIFDFILRDSRKFFWKGIL